MYRSLRRARLAVAYPYYRFMDLPPRRRALNGVGIAVGLFMIVGTAVLPALTNSVVVDPVVANDVTHPFSLNDLRPVECGATGYNITANGIASGGGTVSKDDGGNLLLADNTTTLLNGGSGADCIVSNGAATINGDINIPGPVANVETPGTGDVCIGDISTVMYNCAHIVRH